MLKINTSEKHPALVPEMAERVGEDLLGISPDITRLARRKKIVMNYMDKLREAFAEKFSIKP